MKGFLLVDKPAGKTSFALVQAARRVFNERCIGHAGTLDPLATGLLILLVGREFTKQSDAFLGQDKAYQTTIELGAATTTYDAEGDITEQSPLIPTLEEINEALASFQGTIWQEPPMFSAKKVGGKKLYDLARKGITIQRKPCQVTVAITLLEYSYPELKLEISCSKGTYIRSLGHDIGKKLKCFGHLKALRRIKSGSFHIDQAVDGNLLFNPTFAINDLKRSSFCDMIPINL